MPLAEAKIAFVFGDELKVVLKDAVPFVNPVFPSKSAQSARSIGFFDEHIGERAVIFRAECGRISWKRTPGRFRGVA